MAVDVIKCWAGMGGMGLPGQVQLPKSAAVSLLPPAHQPFCYSSPRPFPIPPTRPAPVQISHKMTPKLQQGCGDFFCINVSRVFSLLGCTVLHSTRLVHGCQAALHTATGRPGTAVWGGCGHCCKQARQTLLLQFALLQAGRSNPAACIAAALLLLLHSHL